jgi:hypothetical protein
VKSSGNESNQRVTLAVLSERLDGLIRLFRDLQRAFQAHVHNHLTLVLWIVPTLIMIAQFVYLIFARPR